MTFPPRPSPHVGEELPGLLLGELGRDDTLRVAGHLRACPGCRADLIDAAVAVGSLASATRTLAGTALPSGPQNEAEPDDQDRSLPPLRVPGSHRNQRLGRLAAAIGAVAAAVALFAAGTTVGHHGGRGSNPPAGALVSAPLRPLNAPDAAGGQVTVGRSGSQVIVDIHTSGLPSPGPDRFYEAWLLDPATNKMMAMGVLPPAGSSTFEVAGQLVHGYSAVDISLQANNGDPAHSNTSVLRATQV